MTNTRLCRRVHCPPGPPSTLTLSNAFALLSVGHLRLFRDVPTSRLQYCNSRSVSRLSFLPQNMLCVSCQAFCNQKEKGALYPNVTAAPLWQALTSTAWTEALGAPHGDRDGVQHHASRWRGADAVSSRFPPLSPFLFVVPFFFSLPLWFALNRKHLSR